MTLHEILVWCPDCPPVRGARAMVLSQQLWLHALEIALPFAITGAVVRWIARRGREATV